MVESDQRTMRVHTAIIAHGECNDAIKRMAPAWKRIGSDWTIYFTQCANLDHLPAGFRTQPILIGDPVPSSVMALRETLKFALMAPADLYVINTPQSACIASTLPHVVLARTGFWSNSEFNPDPRVFRSQVFMHPPYAVDVKTLKALVDAMFKLDDCLYGNAAAWLGHVFDLSPRIERRRYDDLGFSRPEIKTHMARFAQRAVMMGATMINGIRTAKMLSLLTATYDNFHSES